MILLWIFTPVGLLMPSAVPDDKVSTKWTWGIFDLQVRGRVARHLELFIEKYMEAGTYNPEIQLTPEMDYNARFYTTKGAFADAMARAVMDIDYTKFKPTAVHDDPYHKVLNEIWGTLTALGKPGGKWGRIIDSYHYKDADGFNVYGLQDPDGGWTEGDYDFTGSTFFSDDDMEEWERERRDNLIADLEGADIALENWVECVSEEEWSLISSYWEQKILDQQWEGIKVEFEKKYDEKKLKKMSKKSGKRAKRGVYFE